MPDVPIPARDGLTVSAPAAPLPKGGLTWPFLGITNNGPEPVENLTIDWLPASHAGATRHRPAWVAFVGGRPSIPRLDPDQTASFRLSPPWVNPRGWIVRVRWVDPKGRKHVADLPVQA